MEMLEEDWVEIFADAYEQDAIPVLPRQKVIYPYEWWYEDITDAQELDALLRAYENGKYIGMIYSAAGDKLLPPIGVVGTLAAFSMQKVTDKRYLVQFRGWKRFTSLKYLDDATVYPMTEIEYYEDDEEDADELRRELELTINLMEETERVSGYKKPHSNPRSFLESEDGGMPLSFFLMKFWGALHETRHYIINLRSTIKRLRFANGLISEYNKNEAVAENLRRNN